jgi:hypothetical protein
VPNSLCLHSYGRLNDMAQTFNVILRPYVLHITESFLFCFLSRSKGEVRKDRRKKRPAKIVSFDGDETSSSSRGTESPAQSVASPKLPASHSLDSTRNASTFCVFDMDPVNDRTGSPESLTKISIGHGNDVLDDYVEQADSTGRLDTSACSGSSLTPPSAPANSILDTHAYAFSETQMVQQSFATDGCIGDETGDRFSELRIRGAAQMKVDDVTSMSSKNSATSAESLTR